MNREWANMWQEEGSQRWMRDRVATVKVNNLRLVSVYQPLWHYGEKEVYRCRRDIEKRIHLSNNS
jgi:hypothetical protein